MSAERHGAVGRRAFLLTALAAGGCALTGPPDRPAITPDTPARVIGRHDATVTGLAVTADGRMLASSGRDGSARLWRLPAGEPVARLQHAPRYLSAWAVEFSPDGARLASAADDLRVAVWDVATGRMEAALTGHLSSIRALAWSPDGRWLASGSKDATVRVWEAGWWVPYAVLRHGDTVRALAFSADGRLLYAGTAEDLIHVWDVPTRRSLRVTARHANTVHALAVSADGATLVSGAGDQRLGVWRLPGLELRAMLAPLRTGEDVTTGERTGLYPGPEVLAVAIGPHGRLVASSHRDSAVRLWRLDTLQEVARIRSPAATSYGLVFAPDGRTLFTGGDDHAIYAWALP